MGKTQANPGFYTSEHILNEFDALSKDKKITVLDSAISYMQEYSGRSKTMCIALAMGYRNTEGSHKSYFKK
jgi:hypothetical protein